MSTLMEGSRAAPTLWSEHGSATSVGGTPRSGSYMDDLWIVITSARIEPWFHSHTRVLLFLWHKSALVRYGNGKTV